MTIQIEKFVSDDEGETWIDADTPPGPSIEEGIDPQFRFVVTNTGNVILTDVEAVDDFFGLVLSLAALQPGGSVEVILTGTWAEGQHVNEVTVEGALNDEIVTDTDLTHYFGVLEAEPAIQIQKLVSVDGGETFVEADSSPGPTLPPNVDPVFRFIVTNVGNVTLTDVEIVDDVLGNIAFFEELAPGEQQVIDFP